VRCCSSFSKDSVSNLIRIGKGKERQGKEGLALGPEGNLGWGKRKPGGWGLGWRRGGENVKGPSDCLTVLTVFPLQDAKRTTRKSKTKQTKKN